jgi:hypothetical protein
MDKTVATAAFGRLANTGQSCVAAKRFIVMADLYEEFVSRLARTSATPRPGDPADAATTLGALSSERAGDLIGQVRDAVDKIRAPRRSPAAGAPSIRSLRRRDRAHGCPTGHARLLRAAVRPGGGRIRRRQRGEAVELANVTSSGRRDGALQRPAARGLWPTGSTAAWSGSTSRPHPGRLAIRRSEAIRVRPGAIPARHARVYQP